MNKNENIFKVSVTFKMNQKNSTNNESQHFPIVTGLHLDICKQTVGFKTLLNKKNAVLLHLNFGKESVAFENRYYPSASKKLVKRGFYLGLRASTHFNISACFGLDNYFLSPVAGAYTNLQTFDVKPFVGVNFIIEFD